MPLASMAAPGLCKYNRQKDYAYSSVLSVPYFLREESLLLYEMNKSTDFN
jgi:hypothetical protein